MALEKPSWLEDWLEELNWDIFTWHVYVGDAIESGIDWLIELANNIWDWAIDAYELANDAWDKAVDVYKLLLAKINSEVDNLLGKIDAWWDGLGDWWDATWLDVQDWVWARISDINDWIIYFDEWSAKIEEWLYIFKTETLPNLIDTVTFWDNVKSETDPIKEDVAKHESWFDLLKELMADPEKWLLDRISSMLARFI